MNADINATNHTNESQPGNPGGLGLEFDNRFITALPADTSRENVRRQLTNALFAHVEPTRVRAPKLVAHAQEVAQLIGLNDAECESSRFREVFSGNELLTGMVPYATCYGGHQFGNWAGQLGDGRAINLGEVKNAAGEHWTLQLKGAGPTPFSRTADGLAVLRSSVREFLCSEAMHHLGVPTTRALSLVTTGEDVLRDKLYDGHPALEPGAVVCRVARSFTRFGHFEMLAARGEIDLLRQLTAFTIHADFPEIAPDREPSVDDYVAWFTAVADKTATMVAHWMRVGFVHGVMNTDNMSVLGLTIDYGPYGWVDDYDPDWTPNTTDAGQRRYRFGQQAAVAQWNLLQLANAIYPILNDAAPLEAVINGFPKIYQAQANAMMASKLGLLRYEPATDAQLFAQLDELLRHTETDMTIFYRCLARLDPADPDPAVLSAAYYQDNHADEIGIATKQWLEKYAARLRVEGRETAERRTAMNAVNPKFVLRNYVAQLAIDAAEAGDFSRVRETLDVLRHPYADQPDHEGYAGKRPDWARDRFGCSTLSCSS